MKAKLYITNQTEVKLENRNLLYTIVSTVLLFVVLTTQSFASTNPDAAQKLAKYNPANVIMSGGSTAKVFGTDKGTNGIYIENPYTNNNKKVWAGTFNGDLDGQNVKFYCIDLMHPLATWSNDNQHEYTDNGNTPQEITYILYNYYPHKTLPYSGSLSETKEAAAVQLAIWHFADGVDANTINYNDGGTLKNRALAIINDAVNNAASFTYANTLTIIPSNQTVPTGQDGLFDIYTKDNLGNDASGINVSLSATTGTLSSTAVTTDATGHAGPISLSQGVDYYSEVTATANVTIPQGTRYVHKTNPNDYQKLVLATPTQGTLNKKAYVTWDFTNGVCDLDNFTTFTQGGWGSPGNSTPGGIRDDYFDLVFPSGLTVGGNYTLTLTSAQAVEEFLPQGSTPTALTQDYTNPGSGNITVFAGQVVALALNVYFHDAGYLGTNPTPLGDLVVDNGPLEGLTVYDLLNYANIALGGGSTPYSITDLSSAADKVNNNFDDGTSNKGFLTCEDDHPTCEAEIGDFVWSDMNCDGIQDAGENGIANVKVILKDDQGSVVDVAFTDGSGKYSFTSLCMGTYNVFVDETTLPEDYNSTAVDQGGDDAKDSDGSGVEVVISTPSEVNNTIDFGYCPPPACENTLGDYIWHDSEVDGIQDNDEEGIEGVVVELTYGNTTLTTTTDENGYYEFTGLENGSYTVKVAASNYASGGVLESTSQTKWYASPKNQGSNEAKDSDADINESVTVNLDCADNPDIDFGFYKTCVTLMKEGPASADPGDEITYTFRVENCGDVTLGGGVDVFDPLLNPSGDHKIKYVTVDPGEVKFFEKKYTIPEDFCGDLINEAWAEGHPVNGSAYVTDDAEWITTVECAPDCSGEIGDRIWLDYRENGGEKNCNGIQNGNGSSAEPGIPNVRVILKDAANNPLDTTYTNQNGNYKFTGLCAGTYHVFVDESTLPSEYTPAPTDMGGSGYDDIDSDVNGVEVILPNYDSKDYTIDFGYCAPPEEPEVDIEIIKTSSSENLEDGDQFNYVITAKNNGPDDAHGVEVTDILPDGVVYISSTASDGSYNNGNGIWMIGNLANGASATLEITVQIDVEDVNNATFNLGVATDYNLFVLYDAEQPSSDTEGRVAVGRNASFANYSIGDKLSANSGDVLVVGNDLDYTSGAIYNGDVAYGNSTNLDSSYTAVSITGGTLRNDYPVDFSAAEAYFQGLSSTLFGYAVNGTTTFEWSGLTLTGTDPYLNVFDVDAADLTAATYVTISVPNGAVVLVNVDGNNVNWSGGLTVNGTSIGNVLYNFNATDITISGIDVRGSILAPYAHVNFVTGVQNGQMICKSLEGMGQFNNTQFIGNIPVEQVICNIATLSGLIETDTNPNNNSDDAKVTINAQDNGSGGNNGGGNNGGNNGNDWEYVGSFLEGQIVWSLAYTDDGSILVGTWGGAIYMSNSQGTDFAQINEGMNVGFIWALLVKDGYYFAGTEQGVFRYDGSSWTLVGLDGMDVRSLVNVNGKIYAGVWGGGIYVSSNNGADWAALNSDMISWAAVQDITAHITVDFNVELFVATLGNGVCFSPDGGASWTKLDLGYNFVWSIASTSTGTLFAGTYGDGLYTSDDDGSSWTKVAGVNAHYVYDITVDANDNVYISTLNGGIYTSNDGGSSFNSAGMGGYGTSSVLAFGSSESNSVYVGTNDGSIYRQTKNNGITSAGTEEEVVKEFALDQNYPNPFNPTTTIQFAIPKAGEYKVVVYNILGEQVAELLNTQLQPGVHSVEFSANNLASGIYIYQLIGNDVNFTKKMILMK